MKRFPYNAFILLLILFNVVVTVSSQTGDVTKAVSNISASDRTVRYEAVVVLARAKDDPRSVDGLIGAPEDPDREIREVAATSLGFRKERRAVSPLIQLLRRESYGPIQGAAIYGLGNIGDPQAVEPLIEVLNLPESNHQYAIIAALAYFNDPRAVMPLFAQMGRGPFSSEIPKAIGSAGVEPMIDIIKSGSETEREYAVWILLSIADERALRALISVLGINKHSVGYTAVSAIALRIGSPAIKPLRDAFENGDLDVKSKVLLTLARIDDEGAGTVLSELVTKKEIATRRNVLRNLADFYRDWPKKDQLITAILAAMDDKVPEMRNMAIAALAGEQRQDVVVAMLKALSDPATSAEASIAVGLRKDPRALPYLFDAVKGNDDPSIAARATQVLVSFGVPAVDGLISVLAAKNREFPLRETRRRREQANASLMFRCGNEPPDPILDPRVLAAYALGEIGDDRARKPLVDALKDEAEWLRDAASAALDRLDKLEQARTTNR